MFKNVEYLERSTSALMNIHFIIALNCVVVFRINEILI